MVNLFPYQAHGRDEINKFFENQNNRRLLKVMPTGTGKTTLFSALTFDESEKGNNVLLIVHRVELVNQIYNRLKLFGLNPGIIANDYPYEREKKVQVASIQTLTRRINPPADLIIIDECHHAKAESYKQLWGIYPRAKILGFTATPIRLDGQGFKDQFQKMLNLYPLKWYFDNKYLVTPEHHVCTYIDEPLKVINGEYDRTALSSLMSHGKYVHDPLKAYLKHSPGKKAVIFCVDRNHSQQVCDDFIKHGIKAAHIDSETPQDIRKSINEGFLNGEISVLTNYDIISEGYDVPDIEVAILARRTKSLALYIQWIGRALRNFKGKTKGIILDCAGLWLEHKSMAGDDFEWSLESGKPKKIKKEVEVPEPADIDDNLLKDFEEPQLAFNKSGQLINMELNMHEKDVVLLPITSEMRRIVVFEAFIHAARKKNHKLLSSVYQYVDYLKAQDTTLSSEEESYCKNRLAELNVAVKDGFWWHLKNKKVA